MTLALLAAAVAHEPEGPSLAGRAGITRALDAPEAHVGGGLALETSPRHHLALEVSVGEFGGGAEVPFEVLVERVATLGAHVEPFVGLGPAVIVGRSPEGAREARAGGCAVVGTHLWLGAWWGVVLEGGVSLTRGPADLVPAADAVSGLVFRVR